jgi:hypothetical protein
MSRFNPAVCRIRLENRVKALRKMGPEHAGKVARIEISLDLDPKFPFCEERYREFCKEVGMTA